MTSTEKSSISPPSGGVRNMMGIINKHMKPMGGSVELKRQMEDGSLVGSDDGENELKELELQEAVKHAAEALHGKTRHEKLEWSKTMREKGNELYRNHKYLKACDVYVISLSGLDFGSTDEERSEAISTIQMPVLSNMAACWMVLTDWNRVITICTQAVNLADGNSGINITNDALYWKCRLRRASAWIHLGKINKAKQEIKLVNEFSALNGDMYKDKLGKCNKMIHNASLKQRKHLKREQINAKRMFSTKNSGMYCDKDSTNDKVEKNSVDVHKDEGIIMRIIGLLWAIVVYVVSFMLCNRRRLLVPVKDENTKRHE